MPSHLRPRPGTASAVGRLSIGRLVGSQCNFDQSSIVARMSSRAMQNGRSWVKKRNLGQKNETLAEKPAFPALFLSVSIERGGGILKNFLALANNSFAPHRWFSEKCLATSLLVVLLTRHFSENHLRGAKELFASPRKIFRIPSPLYIETLRKSAGNPVFSARVSFFCPRLRFFTQDRPFCMARELILATIDD